MKSITGIGGDSRTSDPFIKISIGGRTFQTGVVYETCSPVYLDNNKFLWCVDIPGAEYLHIEVFDYDRFSGTDKIAEANFLVQDLVDGLGSGQMYSPYARKKLDKLFKDLEAFRRERGIGQEEVPQRAAGASIVASRMEEEEESRFLGLHWFGKQTDKDTPPPPEMGAEGAPSSSSSHDQRGSSSNPPQLPQAAEPPTRRWNEDEFVDEEDVILHAANHCLETDYSEFDTPENVVDELRDRLDFILDHDETPKTLREIKLQTVIVDENGEEETEGVLLKERGFLSTRGGAAEEDQGGNLLHPNGGDDEGAAERGEKNGDESVLTPKQKWLIYRNLKTNKRMHDARIFLNVGWQPMDLSCLQYMSAANAQRKLAERTQRARARARKTVPEKPVVDLDGDGELDLDDALLAVPAAPIKKAIAIGEKIVQGAQGGVENEDLNLPVLDR